MEPEKLKVIAEGMNYKTAHIHKGRLFYDAPLDMPVEYNPLTNNDQMVECYKLLLDKGFVMAASEQDASYAIYLLGKFICEGKTINEAVCNAAYEYFK